LLKQVIPELNLAKYSLARRTVKQIKILFLYFYANRVNFLIKAKRKTKAEKKENDPNKEILFTHAFSPSDKSQKSAESFRKKVFDRIEKEQELEKRGSHSQSPEHITLTNKVKPKLRLDEVYNILRKKKGKRNSNIENSKRRRRIEKVHFSTKF